jgi:phosphatidylglycerophosphate synthase
MIDSAAVILAVDGRLPWIGAAAVLARDVILVAGYPLVRERGYDFSVSMLGKVATWVLYMGVTGLIASSTGTTWPLWVFWIGVGLAVAAALLYILKAYRETRA